MNTLTHNYQANVMVPGLCVKVCIASPWVLYPQLTAVGLKSIVELDIGDNQRQIIRVYVVVDRISQFRGCIRCSL